MPEKEKLTVVLFLTDNERAFDSNYYALAPPPQARDVDDCSVLK